MKKLMLLWLLGMAGTLFADVVLDHEQVQHRYRLVSAACTLIMLCRAGEGESTWVR